MMDAPERPEPELTAEAGPWGGRAYSRRGAEIRRLKGGHVCGLLMEGCPLHGATFGVAVAVTPSEDLWVEEGRLPSYLRVVPKPSRTQPAMTEADARAALAAFDAVGGLERWIAARPWHATPGGWVVPEPLQGQRFRVERAPGGVRVIAFMGEGEPAAWVVPGRSSLTA